MHPGFKPTNHPHQIETRGVDDSTDDRETPPCVFVPLDAEYRFTLDAAASRTNRKCPHYCTRDGTYDERVGTEFDPRDGLHYPWAGERVWCNPPFSGLRPWVERAWDEQAELVCMVLPNNRSEQPFWQRYVEPYRDRPGSVLISRNLPKRRPFLSGGAAVTTLGANGRATRSPPFGLVILIWDRRQPVRPGVAL